MGGTGISPAFLKAILAVITAMISLIIAAETTVPDTIFASDGSKPFKADTAIPVKTRETPECGRRVNPRYFVTAGSACVIFPPRKAPPIFPAARESI